MIELLLAGGPNELLATVTTGQGLVLEAHVVPVLSGSVVLEGRERGVSLLLAADRSLAIPGTLVS